MTQQGQRATINGREIDISEGETILEAAAMVGVAVPILCHDERVTPSATCRVCVVKVEGRRLPIAACAQKIEPGMTVVTEDDDLSTWRKGIIELTLSELGGGACLSCEMHGPCDLHALAAEVGAEPGALRGATSAGPKLDDSNPFILRDYDQCIFCYRCTRVCGEHEQAHAIGPAGRGFASIIATSFDGGLMDSPCTFCGQCIQTCPTGALLDRRMIELLKDEGAIR
ncbi:MAG: 2Fe-2S iron-sulfur cluster-binding protein [Dehalococcoidia bacterium]|jgi:NADH dehydrogenase/NADH:ubiquinone oxidoreductase subunit G|nr:2Fe-2S iron-sulfur cluster-binding protein [Dehalococcoidia bacterium]